MSSPRAVPQGVILATMLALGGPIGGPFATRAEAAPSTFERADPYVVQIDGSAVEGAQVFERRGGGLLVDIPGQPTLFLIDLRDLTAFALRPENVVRSEDGKSVSVKERFAWSVPISREPTRKQVRFPIDERTVLVMPQEPDVAGAAGAPGGAAPAPASSAAAAPAASTAAVPPPSSEIAGGTSSPATEAGARQSSPAHGSGSSSAPPAPPATSNGKSARECVSLVVRPASGVPQCSQSVYIRNICDAPVQAVVQRTEHLMSGTLPQIFDVTVVPGEQWLGCAWWSGAMAPAEHEIAGAAFLPSYGRPHDRR